MNLKDDFEPCDENVFENDLRFKKEVSVSKRIFKYHPNLYIKLVKNSMYLLKL